MRKTRIEVRADIAACADAREAARIAVDNWHDETIDMADSDGEAEIDPTNIGLAEFGVQTETSLADSVRETRRKWAIDNFTKCSNNNLLTSLIMNIGAESATHMEESLTIRRCQVDALDRPDIGNIDHVSEDVVSSWQEIIRCGGQSIKIDTDIDMDYDHHESNPSSHPNSSTGILEPIIGEIEMLEEHLTEVESSHLGDNPQAIILCDIIQDRLSLNHLQKVVVEEVLNHAIHNEGNQCHLRSDQLLLYVRGKRGVGKSRIVKAIYLGFSFLKRRKELLIAAPTGAAAANIGGATIHGALSIDDCIQKQQRLPKGPWQNRSALILDEISMVSLKLLSTIDIRLSQAKDKPNNDTAVLGGLALVIVMRDFYQFPSVVGRSLWTHPVTSEEIHGKDIWNQFTSVITLIEQIRHHDDKLFQVMLTRARRGLLNNDDVAILNSKEVVTILILNPDEQVVIVQQNATRHTINRIQIKRFAKAHNRDVILFPAEHSRIKKDGGQIVDDIDLLIVQDTEETCIRPGILHYCKRMPACLLTNMNTQLGMVNGARILISSVIPDPQGNIQLFDLSNFAN